MELTVVFATLVVCSIGSVAGQNKLILSTRATAAQPTSIDLTAPAAVKQSAFSASRPTKILIHGYLDNYNALWWTQMVSEFLQGEDLNVFRLNWGASSSGAYAQGVSNAATVGGQVATFVQYLISQYGITPQSVHVIGHSLGAHTAGAVGEALRGRNIQLGRITGLDPAGPGFTNAASSSRLDPTDAKVVDTIITNSIGLGSPQLMGHINFLPNGGQSQPTCLLSAICSHVRAVTLFTASINNVNGGIYARLCDSAATYVQRGCVNNPQILLGYHTDLSQATSAGLQFYSIG